jgi:Regulator of chromosome condensation (RCC1) repeat
MVGCSESGSGFSNGPIAILEVTCAKNNIPVGTIGLCTATAKDANGKVLNYQPVDIEWHSSEPITARLRSDRGTKTSLVGISEGETEVTAIATASKITSNVFKLQTSGFVGATFDQITTGFNNACGLTSNGKAYCWGLNADGIINGSDTEYLLKPTPVGGDLKFKSISMGSGIDYGAEQHMCGLTENGKAYCWGGTNNYGLGDGKSTWSHVPIPVAQDLVFSKIATQRQSTCGLTPSGKIYCWGYIPRQNTGDNPQPKPISVPTLLYGNLTFSDLFDESGLCGLATNGKGYCWGYFYVNWAFMETPIVQVENMRFSNISGFHTTRNGNGYACGVTTEGKGYCWGDLQTNAQEVIALSENLRFSKIGFTNTGGPPFALALDGKLYRYSVGFGLSEFFPLTKKGAGLLFSTVSNKGTHFCGLTLDKRAYCWIDFGSTGSKALGNPDFIGSSNGSDLWDRPIPVAALPQ